MMLTKRDRQIVLKAAQSIESGRKGFVVGLEPTLDLPNLLAVSSHISAALSPLSYSKKLCARLIHYHGRIFFATAPEWAFV